MEYANKQNMPTLFKMVQRNKNAQLIVSIVHLRRIVLNVFMVFSFIIIDVIVKKDPITKKKPNNVFAKQNKIGLRMYRVQDNVNVIQDINNLNINLNVQININWPRSNIELLFNLLIIV